MKTIRNDYCIKMFVDSGNNSRPQLNEIHIENGYLYAANTNMLAKVNSELCVKKYKAIENYPNVEKILKEHNSIKIKKIKVDVLFDKLMELECSKPEMINCDICNGDGVITCSYCNNEHECKNCDGLGEDLEDELKLTKEGYYNLFDTKYKLSHLDIIIKTAIILKVETIEISISDNYPKNIFNVGDFTILPQSYL